MRVYLVGSTQFDEGFQRFYQENFPQAYEGLDDMTPVADQLVETAGRLCYMSYGKGRKTNKEHVENLLKQGHGSVLEHANFTFAIVGVTRSLTHELVRHRHFSFSQVSQRYVNEEAAEFILPESIQQRPDLVDVCHRAFNAARTAYQILVSNLSDTAEGDTPTAKRKAARGAARCVLPNATETAIMVTGNARAWRHFLRLRGSMAADAEIRQLAILCFSLLQARAPALFQDVRIEGGALVVDNVT